MVPPVLFGVHFGRMMGRKPQKKWRKGDLVLHQSAPKTHFMLMEVLEVNERELKAAFLDPAAGKSLPARQVQSETGWYAMEEMLDPAVFLRTEVYLQTLRDRKRQG